MNIQEALIVAWGGPYTNHTSNDHTIYVNAMEFLRLECRKVYNREKMIMDHKPDCNAITGHGEKCDCGSTKMKRKNRSFEEDIAREQSINRNRAPKR